jgi:hypothetical protein
MGRPSWGRAGCSDANDMMGWMLAPEALSGLTSEWQRPHLQRRRPERPPTYNYVDHRSPPRHRRSDHHRPWTPANAAPRETGTCTVWTAVAAATAFVCSCHAETYKSCSCGYSSPNVLARTSLIASAWRRDAACSAGETPAFRHTAAGGAKNQTQAATPEPSAKRSSSEAIDEAMKAWFTCAHLLVFFTS